MTVQNAAQFRPAPADRSWSIALPRPRSGERSLQPSTMNAGELMFFYGAPLAHVVQYEEHLRATRHYQATRRLLRSGAHNVARQLAKLDALPPSTRQTGPIAPDP